MCIRDRALGAEDTVEPDFFQVDIIKDDIFILCTDGLYDEVDELSLIHIWGAKKVLSAAAMTYVASLAVAVAQLLRLLAMRGRD